MGSQPSFREIYFLYFLFIRILFVCSSCQSGIGMFGIISGPQQEGHMTTGLIVIFIETVVSSPFVQRTLSLPY